MDGLSALTTVVSVVETAWQVIEYVKAVAGAGEERQKLLHELIRARGLLATLRDLYNEAGGEEWAVALESLDGRDGALAAFKALLEEIMDEIGVKGARTTALPSKDNAKTGSKSKRLKLIDYMHLTSSSRQSVTSQDQLKQSVESPAVARNSDMFKAFIKALKWPFTQPRLQELLNTLERIKSNFLLALSSDNVRLSRVIRNELQDVHGEVRGLGVGLKGVKEDTAAIIEYQQGPSSLTEEQQLIIQSISSLRLQANINQERLEYLERSGAWLLHHQKFQQWRNRGGALLLVGGPATGKTSLCKIVETLLQASGPATDVCAVAVYFSIANQPGSQSLQSLLAFIVNDMLRTHPRFQRYYNKLMLTGEGPLEVADSFKIIHRARQDFKKFYVLLDALDECEQDLAREIVKRLTSLRSPLRLFATSRLQRAGCSF